MLQSSATQLVFRVANGVGTLVSSSAYDLSAAVDSVMGFVGVDTGSQLQLWINNAQVGTDQAITGYTALSNRTYVGAAGSSTPYIDFFGAGTAEAVPSAENIAAWFAAVKGAKRIVAMPGITSNHLWMPVAAASISDSIGADTLSLGGTGHELVKTNSPAWGW